MPIKRNQPPVTISRGDYLTDGTDQQFRETIYTMVQSATSLLNCRAVFGSLLGLTGSQYAVLIGVAYRQGENGVLIKDLAEHVSLASTHVTTEVGRLERKGFLRKKMSADDRRGVLVSLSSRGQTVVERIAPTVQSINDILFKGIPRNELDAARRVAKAVVENAKLALVQLKKEQKA